VRDDFTLQGGDALTAAISGRYHEWEAGPYSERARGLLVRRYDTVVDALGRLRLLTGSVRAMEPRFVVTHGEPHRGNVIDTADGPVLVDWDTARLAPAERDLWWFTGDGDVLDAYEAAGGWRAEPTALEYYRLRWTLTDLALFTDELRRAHADDDDSQLAWDALQECYRTL
jgi:aminoglycoside phosphotransferase (APT) family kinase protein